MGSRNGCQRKVSEESSETGQNCRGSQTYFEASLQRQKNNKGVVQRNSQKAVPKICHSKHGEINPSKIEKLVSGYIKKYQHAKRKEKKKSKIKNEPFSF